MQEIIFITIQNIRSIGILDNATFPTAFMYLLQDSGIDRVGTQMLDKCNAQVVFSDLQDFDNTAITTDDIIEECILKEDFGAFYFATKQ